MLQSSSSLRFLEKHKEFFLNHDLLGIPLQFVNRIGELSGASVSMDSMANINEIVQIARDARQFFWASCGEQPLESIATYAYEQAPENVRFRFLFPEQYLPYSGHAAGPLRKIEWKGLIDMPVNIAVSEDRAGISFRSTNGIADYTGFLGKDPAFVGWVKDLFQYYWDKGTRV